MKNVYKFNCLKFKIVSVGRVDVGTLQATFTGASVPSGGRVTCVSKTPRSVTVLKRVNIRAGTQMIMMIMIFADGL